MTINELMELTIPDIYYILNSEQETLTESEIRALEERLAILEKETEEEIREHFEEHPKEFNCPKCDALLSSKYEECPYCNYTFKDEDYYNTIQTPTNNSSKGSSNTVLYIVSFLIPLIGIILGLIYIAKDDEILGKSLLTFSIVVTIVFAVINIILIMPW